jgi:ABC-type transport system involved in Fe-S cluster assembly fused permease/ATPase subunit
MKKVVGTDVAIDTYQHADLISQATMWILDGLQNVIIQTGLIVGCLLCAKRILVDGTMTVGDFVLFLSYLTQLYGPLNYFGNYYKTIQKNFVDMEKMMDLFEESIEIEDSVDAVPLQLQHTAIEFSIHCLTRKCIFCIRFSKTYTKGNFLCSSTRSYCCICRRIRIWKVHDIKVVISVL